MRFYFIFLYRWIFPTCDDDDVAKIIYIYSKRVERAFPLVHNKTTLGDTFSLCCETLVIYIFWVLMTEQRKLMRKVHF